MYICKCGEDIEVARWNLGLRKCLDCGELDAQMEIQAKRSRVMQMHKSNAVYVGNNIQYVKDISRMRKG
jgi:hypothetical protein